MLSFKQNILALTVAGSLCACAPSAEQHAGHDHDDQISQAETAKTTNKKFKTGHAHAETVKPGASITLKSVLPKAMTSGVYQTVRLEFTEGYEDGVMTVSIEPSEGLNLFGGSSAKTFNMAPATPHIWEVDVKADTDGVYFLNVFAEAQGLPRSFSVRINMGVVSQKMFDDAMPADGELVEGGKIRALEATETIK